MAKISASDKNEKIKQILSILKYVSGLEDSEIIKITIESLIEELEQLVK